MTLTPSANAAHVLRGAIVLLAAACATVLLALPASGHALVRATTPADGESLEQSPGSVAIEFNEPVSMGAGGIRVFDEGRQRVDNGDASAEGETASITLQPELDDGSYIVSWRATSADGHPVHAAFLFTVGDAAAADDDLVASVLAGDSDAPFQIAAAITRFLQYAAALLAAGGVLFMVLIHDRLDGDQPVLSRIVVIATAVAAIATVVGIGLQAALVTGLGLSAAVSPQALRDVVTSTFGASAVALLVGLAIVTITVRRVWTPVWSIIGLAGAAITAASFVITGHTATTTPRWLVVGGDLAHTFAGAAWFGGLALLLVTLRRRRNSDDAVGAGTIVGRFSSMATYALVIVSIAGLALAWAEVRAARALFTTSYGITLVIKVAVVAVVVAVAAYNRRRLVPSMTQAGSAAWARLRSTVRFEVIGLTLVLVVTAWLVNIIPARDAAGITAPLADTIPMGEDYQLSYTVEPNRQGPNTIHLYLLSAAGRPTEAEELLVELSMPAEEIGPLEREPTVAGPGHWVLRNSEIPLPGRWVMNVTANVSRFEQATAEATLDVGA